MSAYRENVVNMYDEQQPIASSHGFDLMSIERRTGGWVAAVRVDGEMQAYISRWGAEWFNEATGKRVTPSSYLESLLSIRVRFIEAQEAVRR